MSKLITVHNQHIKSPYLPTSRRSAGTIVVELPEVEDLLNVFSKSIRTLEVKTFPVKIGATFLHHKDQLNKKKGRELAISRMKTLDFFIELYGQQNSQEALWLNLYAYDAEYCARYSVLVKVYRDCRKLRIMGASSFEDKGST